MGKRIDETGNRYGRLTVIGFAGVGAEKRALWRCRCDCGRETVLPGNNLRSGNTKSCGCLNIDMSTKRIVKLNTKHGKTHDPLFKRWSSMLTRCENPNAINYKDYGGRGIKVCEEWHDFEVFYNWAVANGYKPKLTIDRIDSNGNYEPGNCRFANRITQAQNRRSTRFIEFNGETMCLVDWAMEYGVDPTNLQGHTDEEIIQALSRYEAKRRARRSCRTATRF